MNIRDSAAVAPPPAAGLFRAALVLGLLTLIVFGFAYSLVGASLGRMFFPDQAEGSLIRRDGKVVGSTLVAQPFAAEGYFQSRPSAAKYDPMAAAGSNQARTNPEMRARVQQARADVAAREGVAPVQVPDDLITQSGSGLDMDISPQAAAIQVARVAKARGMTPAAVAALVRAHTAMPQFGLYGQPRVNVLALNLGLDAAARAHVHNAP